MSDRVRDLMAELEASLGKVKDIGNEAWLRERFPDKDWHRHRRYDGGTDLCDGTPSDCQSKPRIDAGGEVTDAE